jgi:hypothetical protein
VGGAILTQETTTMEVNNYLLASLKASFREIDLQSFEIDF